MAKAAPLVMRNSNTGIQTSANSGLVGSNALRFAMNCYIDSIHGKIGNLTTRNGVENVFGYIDADIAAIDNDDEICGLHAYSGESVLAAVDTNGGSTYIYDYRMDTGNWTDTGAVPLAWTNNRTIHFESFINYIFAADGSAFKSWDRDPGTNWGTTHLTSAPVNVDLLRVFNGRLYAASYAGPEVFFSSLPDASNNITWTSTDYLKYEKILESRYSALEVNQSLLLIFTSNNMFTWDGQTTQSQPLYRYGAVNQEVVQTIKNKTLFLSQAENYLTVMMYAGSEPIDVGEPVREFLKKENLVSGHGVPAEFGSWKDYNNYYLSISDVTIEGVTYSNVVLCYNVDSGAWSTMSIAKKAGTYNNFFKYSSTFAEEGVVSSVIFDDVTAFFIRYFTVLGGTPLGTTTTNNTGISPVLWDYKSPSGGGDDVGETTDNPIDVLIQTHELEWGSRSRLKTVHKFKTFASGNYGFINVEVRVDGGSWEPLGGLTDKTTTIEVERQGYYFEFRWIGQNTGEQFVWEGYDFGDWVDIEDYEV